MKETKIYNKILFPQHNKECEMLFVKEFYVRNFRSLKDVRIENLDRFNVFYGENGSGKSNIINAIQLFFKIIPIAIKSAHEDENFRISFREAGRKVFNMKYIKDDDFYLKKLDSPIIMGAVFKSHGSNQALKEIGLIEGNLKIEMSVMAVGSGEYSLRITHCWGDTEEIDLPFKNVGTAQRILNSTLLRFSHIGMGREKEGFDGITDRLVKIKNTHQESELRLVYESIKKYALECLGDDIDVFYNHIDESWEIQIRNQKSKIYIPIKKSGYGILQVYSILLPILMERPDIVTLEEPEANLHAPTMGSKLRRLLKLMIEGGHSKQIFIATHSNLFDLDSSGYWDVSLVDGETKVERKPLDEIDRLHLYEPGPAKHQLQQLLQLYDEEIVFRTLQSEYTARQMLDHLQEDSIVACSYLKALHGAAVQVTGLRSRRAYEKKQDV